MCCLFILVKVIKWVQQARRVCVCVCVCDEADVHLCESDLWVLPSFKLKHTDGVNAAYGDKRLWCGCERLLKELCVKLWQLQILIQQIFKVKTEMMIFNVEILKQSSVRSTSSSSAHINKDILKLTQMSLIFEIQHKISQIIFINYDSTVFIVCKSDEYFSLIVQQKSKSPKTSKKSSKFKHLRSWNHRKLQRWIDLLIKPENVSVYSKQIHQV